MEYTVGMVGLQFKAKVETYNGNPYVLVSAARVSKLKSGWRKAMPVLVQINGKPETPWRINMMPIGNGSFYLYLHGIVRKASGTKVGDMVAVSVKFDSSYKNGPMHAMPLWFKKALAEAKNKKAKAAWDALIPSRQKEILRYFSWLKSKEAQARNLEKVLHVLAGNPGRFMARSWKEGR